MPLQSTFSPQEKSLKTLEFDDDDDDDKAELMFIGQLSVCPAVLSSFFLYLIYHCKKSTS